ncbi:alpha/beta-hydrolase [Xylariaceae sp. FL0804]|nr:alpha/beta-hydrolase [Xylariaceae sp. FL0804]
MSAEWIEMRSHYNARKKADDPGRRIMLYVHGGAYYFGSVDEHRYQMQRHARKLQARVFAPKYRLSPQFPFPCGLYDCLAAYLYLLTTYDPSTIVLAGDSAGGGMVLSMLVILRDRGVPLPAGAILISPWVDLTHSFPSVAGHCPLDYIPQCGFHHKPSKAWPPLNAEEYALLKDELASNAKLEQTKLMKPAAVETRRLSQGVNQLTQALVVEDGASVDVAVETTYLSINLDGKEVQLKDQIQLYTTNELLSHPLVSPVMQPTLGGLPPLFIMTGGGEILRDEQIYLAHKCANPKKYPPSDAAMNETGRKQLARFKPTDVQLQIWDDLCHVAPTLSFTRPAKFMYRSVAQFGAWALARAQKRGIEILDDDDVSFISSSGSDSERSSAPQKEEREAQDLGPEVGKAGDRLPDFEDHMIRQRVNRHGVIRPLEAASDLPGCTMTPEEVGVIKEGPVRKWLEARRQWDNRYGTTRAKIHKQRLKEMTEGYVGFDGETPPPSALASRRKAKEVVEERKKTKSMGLSLWSLWGSKHDEATFNREQEGENEPEVKLATTSEGQGARRASDIAKQGKSMARKGLLAAGGNRSRSRTKVVRDEHQVAADDEQVDENTPMDVLLAKREEKAEQDAFEPQPLPSPRSSTSNAFLSPDFMPLSPTRATGSTGKRPVVGGIAVPFSLNREADTASMITLTSNLEPQQPPSRVASPAPTTPASRPISRAAGTSLEVEGGATTSAAAAAAATEKARDEVVDPAVLKQQQQQQQQRAGEGPATATAEAIPSPADGGGGDTEEGMTATPGPAAEDGAEQQQQQVRPPLETFITAAEDLPRAQ